VLGEIVHDKLIKPGALLVGTVTRDGSARISGVEPLIMGDELWLSMMRTSMKARDLHRDPRILLHSLVNGPAAAPEVKVRGSVVEETDRDVQERYAAAAAAEWAGVPWSASSRCFAWTFATSPTSDLTLRPAPSTWPAGPPASSTSGRPPRRRVSALPSR
jgi:hypothetical protein